MEARIAVAQNPGSVIREVLATLSQEERDVVRRICERRVSARDDAALRLVMKGRGKGAVTVHDRR